ncbi:hypothetical protein MKS88_000967 [Plasmodium brasilianum]|uniref:Uncharacterized protein n=1 Tax=Plasmodium brasilianum TaxID=5824 RepID=A0ACB9YGI9_PLABR|nr:hypothetical protein MKS88_000967 [Plasmodium brasilianum]
MSGKVFGKLTEGVSPYIWRSNLYFLDTYKCYSSVLSCLSRRYHMTSKKMDKSIIDDKKDSYRYYNERIKKDITPLNLVKSLPSLNHYVNIVDMSKFAIKYILSYRFFFIYMARTTFQVLCIMLLKLSDRLWPSAFSGNS